jgi:hypothetical protein
MKPTADQVWRAVCADPAFTNQSFLEIDAVRFKIENLVKLFDGKFKDPVTPCAVIDARATFLRHCATDNAFLEELSGKLGLDVERIKNGYLDATNKYQSTLQDTTVLTAVKRQIRDELHADNKEKWRSGTLTIGDLLVTQPSIILQG